MRRRQLRMFLSSLEHLPELEVPAGYAIRSFQPGDEEHWAAIIDASFGGERTAENTRREILDRPEYMPGGLFFATYEGKPIGTTCAWRQSQEETEVGYVHMVGVVPEHRGHKLLQWLSLQVLIFLKEHGFNSSSQKSPSDCFNQRMKPDAFCFPLGVHQAENGDFVLRRG